MYSSLNAEPSPLVIYKGKPITGVSLSRSTVTANQDGTASLITNTTPTRKKKKGIQGKLQKLNDILDQARSQMQYLRTDGLNIEEEIEATTTRVQNAIDQLSSDFDRQCKQMTGEIESLKKRSIVREQNDKILNKSTEKSSAICDNLSVQLQALQEEIIN